MPDEPEGLGLLALMLLSESRRPARSNPDGTMVRLADQDRSRWDQALIIEGHQLVRACLRRNQPGPFQIQAAIAAVHADAPTAEATDWSQIIALYDQLYALRPHPVVALNRSVAIAELHGPAEGLAALAAIDAATLDTYQPYHAARADLLARAGRRARGTRRLRPSHRTHDQRGRTRLPRAPTGRPLSRPPPQTFRRCRCRLGFPVRGKGDRRAGRRRNRKGPTTMGTIKAHEFISLDGVIDAPTWTFDYGFDPAMGRDIGNLMSSCAAVLLGRNTYEM